MAQELSVSGGTPRGSLRVSASPGFGRHHVAPALSEFALRYPEVEVRLEILDRPVDPVAEGIDVDIRVGGLREPHLYAQRLADNRRVLCAAPSYLARHGRPGSLAELAQHRCLVIRERDQAFGVWRLEGPDGVETVKVRGSLSANDGEIIHRWALRRARDHAAVVLGRGGRSLGRPAGAGARRTTARRRMCGRSIRRGFLVRPRYGSWCASLWIA